MAIDTISPVADSQFDPGDSFSFRIDDTYTSITIEVETAGGWEYAYDSALSGAQAGYTVAVTIPTAGRHLFTVTRSAGWNLSPFSIRVVEDETGASATTTTNYTLYSANDYPQSSDPYFLQSIGDSLLAHSDTPSTYSGQSGKGVAVKAGEDGVEFVTLAVGDVVGPGASTDNSVALFDGVTGKLLQSPTELTYSAGVLQLSASTPEIKIKEHTSAPSTPAAGFVTIYAKTDGKLYIKDDAGLETNLTTGGGGGSGDVVGPASAIDNGIPTFDGTTGKLIQDPGDLVYSAGQLRVSGVTNPSIRIAERSSQPAAAASFGYLWVKDDVATTLRFVDDAGVDRSIMGDLTSDGTVVQQRATFDTAPASPPTAEGTIFWDEDDHTLALKPDVSASTMQVGQENWVRVYNDSGAQIDNGSIVYISGAEGVEGRPTIALAQADDSATAAVLGAATSNIANGAFGYVTQFGLVRDVDTSAITAGSKVWLSATAAGGYTDTEPESPNFSVFLGYVIVQNAVTGVGFMTALGNTSNLPAEAAGQLDLLARKGSAGTINPGQVVYLSGYNVGQDVVEVELADADDPTKMPALGITESTITNSSNGLVTIGGIVSTVDTSSWSVGDALYVGDTAGTMTNVRPSDDSQVQKVGTVARSNASNGRIHVTGAGRSNDITNSLYLPEQADHLQTPAAGYGELWVRNDATQELIFTDDAGEDRSVATENQTYPATATYEVPFTAGALPEYSHSANFKYNIVTNNIILAAGSLDLDVAGAALSLKEGAAPDITPAAGDGSFWVRNDTPNVPMFTDDAGTDHQIDGDVVGPASATNGAVALYDGTTGKLLKDLGATFTAASGGRLYVGMTNAYMRMKEKASAASTASNFGDWWVRNDAPNSPMFTDDTGNDIYLGETSTVVLSSRCANAGTSTYVHGSGAAPWDYTGMNQTLSGAQGSPGDPTAPSGGMIVPFDGVITSVSGVVRDSTTNASTTGDLELWKWNGSSDTAISTWTGTQVGTSLYALYSGRTTAGNWVKFSQTPNLSVSAGDYLEPLLYVGTVSASGLMWFSMTITIERR